MEDGHFENLKHKIGGDKRDQRAALRDAGFADEAEAAAWARGILGQSESANEANGIRKIRQARPDLTLRTATYILHQMRAHPSSAG